MSSAILPDIPASAISNEEEQYLALVNLRDSLEVLFKQFVGTEALTNIDNTVATLSASYTQVEVQQVANDNKTTADKVDLILIRLREAGIIGE